MIRKLFHSMMRCLSKVTAPSLIGRAGGESAALFLLFLISLSAQAQTIGGNVYGGGNQAAVGGNSTVTVLSVDKANKVFGGARMADIGGRTYVNIDGEDATGDIFITDVFGGNDISGTIGTSTVPVKTIAYPTGLTEVLAEGESKEDNPQKNEIDDTWNTFVRTSRSASGGAELYPIIIGNLYGGGNGDYTYFEEDGVTPLKDENDNYIVKSGNTIIATRATEFTPPTLGKTYLEIKGGCIAHVYGGGNNATVTENTTLCINNESDVLTPLLVKYATTLWNQDPEGPHTIQDYISQTYSYIQSIAQLNTFQAKIDNTDFNFARIFGGNNKATMSIRPTWNLQQGRIRDLYSGGNRGSMTSPEGLLLDIKPKEDNKLFIDNVFGGCRMADVRPLDPVTGDEVTVSNLDGYAFPKGLSARVLVHNGEIKNVYGGNDITGKVFGGSAVGIYHTIHGDVYGGGNGAYAYTNREDLKENKIFSDFYYPQITGLSDEESLNAFRPNAEQVSIRLYSPDEVHKTIIKGSVYLGGNCASIKTDLPNPMVELKIGSNVIADKVFLGNNGAGMISENILKLYKGMVDDHGELTTDGSGQKYSDMELTDPTVFSGYMDGVTMELQPSIVFDSRSNGDRDDYEEYSSSVGSFYCGGNVGSMAIAGKNTYEVSHGLNIFDKFVGGCNRANVPVIYDDTTPLNASYEGGVLGHADTNPTKDERASYTDASGNIKDRLEINLKNMTIVPKRWNDTKTELVWNTQKMGVKYEPVANGTTLTNGNTYYTSENGDGQFTSDGTEVADGSNYFEPVSDFVNVPRNPSDKDIRLSGGNVYGGCYESGHVNGNVIINIEDNLLKREEVFGTTGDLSGVELEDQRDDLMAVAMTVFGAGYGEETEIWGSTAINLNKGYAFQIFGGGEMGVVGKKKYDASGRPVLDKNDDYIYEFNPAYSSTVNLSGTVVASSSDGEVEGLAETEYIYGGGNEGDVCGNTLVNLGKGRIYDAFGGASDADILGHAEVYIGRQPRKVGSGYEDAFPWIKDIVYGGNDFGGTIHGEYEDSYDVTARVKNFNDVKGMLHGYSETAAKNKIDSLLRSASYVEYLQGRVDTIFGGSYGYYKYDLEMYKDDEGNSPKAPYLHNSFVNIRPNAHEQNFIKGIFGAGTGYPGYRLGDKSQDRSYILVDIPDNSTTFSTTRIFGSGSYNGLGMDHGAAETFAANYDPDRISAIVDLLHGRIASVYGGGYNEGVTARTVINVPASSTIQIDSIFGGAYGTKTLPPCDVFESNVNYASDNARLYGAIYGGNNSERRTLYAKVNISSPVWSNKEKGYLAKVYGAGHGENTWSEYTEVNLNDGAKVYEVYGGGELGHVLSAESVQKYMEIGYSLQGCASLTDPKWIDAWTLGSYYTPDTNAGKPFAGYAINPNTNLSNDRIIRRAEMDDRDTKTYRYNTNVLIHQGATVEAYAYGGGLGTSSRPQSGDVWGSTYIALLGGVVKKNLYAAGSSGGVNDAFGVKTFTASANAYIEGGSVRNVFGGGWEGHVGLHTGDLSADYSDDIPGETHVVIGKTDGNTFFEGVPAVERNAYGGGEGGSVFGTANLTVNNGYIGYRYLGSDSPYYFTYSGSGPGDHPESDVLKASGTKLQDCFVEKIDDETNYHDNNWLGKESLIDCGNLFGSGYDDLSSVDYSNVNLYGGKVRNCVFGGGEISIVGRGTRSSENAEPRIHKAGQTNVNMYDGHVLHNVYGGGKGYNTLGYGGGHNRFTDGYIFGQTRVNIRGGEIGTEEGVTNSEETGKVGNVFGGGDAGFVYSAYELADGTLCFGKKPDGSTRYDRGDEGYYYKHNGTAFVDNEGTPLAENAEKILTEDCKVVVEPWLKATTAISYGGKDYAAGDYVPTAYLNTLPEKDMTGGGTGEWTAEWSTVDAGTGTEERGIIIHNAVFAGGNITLGSSNLNANTNTVFGNATASIHDVYNRDLITLGTGNIGGLYGDGNLTLVDGYRELNITNYGTDYYHINKENKPNKQIEISAYYLLPEREKAYYEVRYKCKMPCKDNEHTTYSEGATLPEDELLVLFQQSGVSLNTTDGQQAVLLWDDTNKKWSPNPLVWEKSGVVSMYAGRILNTIQRADFCGVFGSRMVMKGARDRIPELVDYTKYTINRVREVSLNKKTAHGNYFGIYSNVNFLGALSSDVDFNTTVRTTLNEHDTYSADYDPENVTITASVAAIEYLSSNPISGVTVSGSTVTAATAEALYKLQTVSGVEVTGSRLTNQTYYDWKAIHHTERKRNNGSCHNQLALASGIYLELTQETSTGKGLYEKHWGPITGVVELDLINVATGIGGGYVYAKNEHGVRSSSDKKQTILTALNTDAATYKKFTYTTDDDTKKEWQTSGNFIHSTQTIIDDCYNKANQYKTGGVPAHYWYINGQVYVYDQVISAYTGSSNAYQESADIPLTITANSHGLLKLIDIQPNRYAYYADASMNPLDANSKLVINNPTTNLNVTYGLNDPISYWDWSNLPAAEKNLFVEDTYIVMDSCQVVGDKQYPAGTVLLQSEYNNLFDSSGNPKTVKQVVDKQVTGTSLDFYKTFRSSNNVSHDTGYLLTYKMTNPKVWDKWYTQENNATHEKDQTGGTGYITAPTYHLKANDENNAPMKAKVLGQNEYVEGDIIHQGIYNAYQTLSTHTEAIAATGHTQATFGPAYIVTTEYEDASRHLYPGATVSTSIDGYTTPAYISTKTLKLSDDEYLYAGNVMTEAEYTALAADIKATVVPAYYCTSAGYYGGNYFEPGYNYDAQEAWSSLSEDERKNFEFNYDALDLLIDPNFDGTQGKKYQYDGNPDFDPNDASTGNADDMIYSLKKSVDYSATYNGISLSLGSKEIKVKHNGTGEEVTVSTIVNGDLLDRDTYESLLNEQHHYSSIKVEDLSKPYYVANTSFYHKKPYAAGQVIDAEDWEDIDLNGTDEIKNSVTQLTFTDPGTYYFCREAYTIAASDNGGKPVKAVVANDQGLSSTGTTVSISKDATKEAGDEVPVGFIIAQGTGSGTEDAANAYCYKSLNNQQVNFLIHGETPSETSTLYVARNSDIKDLSKEKIITVIYQYDYEESDVYGNVTPISERHIVNIHLMFEDGEPSLGEIQPPAIVLPGTAVSPKVPKLTTSAHEVIGGGWELYESEENAKSHAGGIPYVPARDPLYWYQDGYFITYYAKTNVGKTYSNYVPVAVANYHDLAEVMSDLNKTHHMYVDHPKVQRESKIYINDYSESGQNGLDLFKDFYDLSLKTSTSDGVTDGVVTAEGSLKGHALLNEHVKKGANLEFFLRADIDHSDNSWTSIGDADNCFQGTLHGDGHTLTGLSSSLFTNLCGDVYNLGVTGTFTGAGVVDKGSGYVENCWISTSSTAAKSTAPVFGAPERTADQKAAHGEIQIVNSYYQEEATGVTEPYTNHAANSSYGTTTRKPAKDFMNGTVAYNLNSFYLNKRYFDANKPGSTQEYKFLGTNATGDIDADMTTGYYPRIPEPKYGNLDYVVDRFADGDYRYAEGVIPTETDVRVRMVKEENPSTHELEDKTYFAPIWPDDYLFFGQMLTYGYGAQPHQDKPSIVTKSNGRLPLGEESSLNNRVYRAPAFFRNKNLSVAHFNFNAYLATQENPETVAEGKTPRSAYPGMTAIDFAGHKGNAWSLGTVTDGYPDGNPGFYPPLLDDDGLLSISNCDETQNLLVYAPTAAANAKTYSVLTSYFTDPEYKDYDETNTSIYDDGKTYRRVADATAESIHGHLVQNDFTASTDHLLVDKQDFNAPMSYTFAAEKRMWYQRIPHLYAEPKWTDGNRTTKGWEGVSLPFTAELVTTNQKGEITHFYSGSENSKNSTGTKIGHEYWLREFKAIKTETQDVSGTPTVVAMADFTYPTSSSSDVDKIYKNSFLWDYYYEASAGHKQKDVNKDTYQTYYKPNGSNVVNTYTKYPLLATATPYIIGFPGASYYEFDLSGSFNALTTYEPHPEKLKQQVITFASNAGATIGVSDDELQGKKITYNGKDYFFMPSYMAETLESVSVDDDITPRSFALNSTGDAFDAVTRAANAAVGTGNVTTDAFRPFFTSATSGSAVKSVTRSIIFSNEEGDLGKDEEQDANRPGELIIRARERKIYVTSTLSEEKAVTIVNSAGALINRFKIKPGETIVTDIHNPGIYLVNKTKLSIK